MNYEHKHNVNSYTRLNHTETFITMDVNAALDDCVERLPFNIKYQQRLANISLLHGKDVVSILPTGFGKSLIFQLYVLTKRNIDGSLPCIFIVTPLKSLVEDQVMELDKFGLSAVALPQVLDKKTKDDIYNLNENTCVIIGSAEEFLNEEFIDILKDQDSHLYHRLSLVVVDECHTVDTW